MAYVFIGPIISFSFPAFFCLEPVSTGCADMKVQVPSLPFASGILLRAAWALDSESFRGGWPEFLLCTCHLRLCSHTATYEVGPGETQRRRLSGDLRPLPCCCVRWPAGPSWVTCDKSPTGVSFVSPTLSWAQQLRCSAFSWLRVLRAPGPVRPPAVPAQPAV